MGGFPQKSPDGSTTETMCGLQQAVVVVVARWFTHGSEVQTHMPTKKRKEIERKPHRHYKEGQLQTK